MGSRDEQCRSAYIRMRDAAVLDPVLAREFRLLYNLSRKTQFRFVNGAGLTGSERQERAGILEWLSLRCLKHGLLSAANEVALELAPWLLEAHPLYPDKSIWEVITSGLVTLDTWRQLVPGPLTHPELWATGWCFPIPHSRGGKRADDSARLSQYSGTCNVPAGGDVLLSTVCTLHQVAATLNSGPPPSATFVASHRLNGFPGSERDSSPHNVQWEVCAARLSCVASSPARLIDYVAACHLCAGAAPQRHAYWP
jgi:hypothetical protein